MVSQSRALPPVYARRMYWRRRIEAATPVLAGLCIALTTHGTHPHVHAQRALSMGLSRLLLVVLLELKCSTFMAFAA